LDFSSSIAQTLKKGATGAQEHVTVFRAGSQSALHVFVFTLFLAIATYKVRDVSRTRLSLCGRARKKIRLLSAVVRISRILKHLNVRESMFPVNKSKENKSDFQVFARLNNTSEKSSTTVVLHTFQ